MGCHDHAHAHAASTPAVAPAEHAPPAEADASNTDIAADAAAVAPVADGTPTLDAAARHPDDPASFQAAIGWQTDAHGWMRDILSTADQGAPSADPTDRRVRLRNTAQWIVGEHAQVTLLTRTHDAHLRSGVDKRDALWFQSARTLEKGPGTFRPADDGTDDRTGLRVLPRSSRGVMGQQGTKLEVFGPTSRHDLEETLIHEVQHDADQSSDNEHGVAHFREDADKVIPGGDVDARKAGSWVYNRYKTEFRAYWIGAEIDGDPKGRPDNRVVLAEYDGDFKHVLTSFKNERQSAIFWHMHRGGLADDKWLRDDQSWSPRNAYAEFFHYYCFDPQFRGMVDKLAAPVGGNLVNSVRIQALSDAIASGDAARIQAAVRALEDADRAFLADKKASAPFWDHAIRYSPSFVTLDDVLEVVDAPIPETAADEASPDAAAEARATTWTVRRGDTLGKIAVATLGDAKRWPEIHRLNRDKIRDPNRLRRGMVLQLPER